MESDRINCLPNSHRHAIMFALAMNSAEISMRCVIFINTDEQGDM